MHAFRLQRPPERNRNIFRVFVELRTGGTMNLSKVKIKHSKSPPEIVEMHIIKCVSSILGHPVGENNGWNGCEGWANGVCA